MNLASLSIKRPVATVMLMLMVVVVGFYSLIGLPRDLFPDIEYPVALVITSYPNASPEEVESMVTEPIEQALASVESLDEMQSMTMQGTSYVMIQFQMDTDMNFATLNMREKIALVSDMLPDDAGDPMVMKMDMSSIPILQLYVSGDMPLNDLNTEIENNVLSYIERVAGVASVQVNGAVDEEVAVQISQEKLTGYGITLAQIAQTLAAENINMPSGNVTKGSTEIIVRTIGEFDSAESIKNLPITLSDRSIVRLGEIANISEQYQDQDSISRIDGKTAIGLMITKQSDANTVATAKEIQHTIKELEQKFPDLTFTVGFNQADFIESSISSVASSAIEGAILAVLVVFLFLKNIRTTLVIALSIPISLLATFAMMSARGMTLNLITLCSLTIAIGLLVDDSIIVLENIFRLRQNGHSAIEASQKGSGEIFLAVLASTLTKVVVFLPIALSGGMAGLMFKDFCFTIIIALLASLIVSLSIVPMLTSRLLSKSLPTDYIRFGTRRYKFRLLPKFTKMIEDLKENYGIFEQKALKKRKRVIFACTLIFVISIVLVGIVGTELLPASDEGMFTVSIDTPYGTSLQDKDKFISPIEEYIRSMPEVKHCTLNIGTSSFMSIGDDSSTLSVTLVDKNERNKTTADIVKKVKKDLSTLSGADISVDESSSMGDMSGTSTDMSLIIKGKELADLESLGNDLCTKIGAIKEVVSAELDVTEGNPEVKVILNRNTAAYYGITASQLANGLSTALSGNTATNLKIDGEEIAINLSLPDSYTDSIDNMKQIMITGSTGLQVPVGQIANLEFDNSPSAVNRLNQQRFVTVNIDIDAKDLNAVSTQIIKIADSYQFPDGYYYETGGQQKEMMETFVNLTKALLVALALVYLLLAAQFESLTQPFMIMMAIPFAMSGAFLALFITGTKLSMISFLGLIMLAGIVVNNSILIVEFIHRNKLIMGRDEALIQAGKLRLRPILMGSATTCVGMIPMSMGLGDGGETLAPMAISIIGGLIASTLVTLILIPVLYASFDDMKMKRENKQRIRDEKLAILEAKWQNEDAKQ
ncbi:efflux RND transporter permease subunit [Clostridium aminobutyricum]|uniref:Efflux RND transporter permease subunit n=1 Tax=Clostridium aminobutyricum TaxID=33953 RepID=A0A939D6L9_CLOAM|nr:efflux RND transporter permease subunit [Clostridium aminobutyricum]MBN7772006.1 efflux RND transporter permease subunit [Clostridium aminobutyricum]